VEKERSRDRLRLSKGSARGAREAGDIGDMVCDGPKEEVTGEAHPDWEEGEPVVAGDEKSEKKTLLALLMVLNFGGGNSSSRTRSSSLGTLWSASSPSVCLSRRANPD